MEGKREMCYALRLPPELHAALVEKARREDRSLNQQLVHLLREGIRREERRRKRAAARQWDAPAPPERPEAGEPG
jgi:hypothetical protein